MKDRFYQAVSLIFIAALACFGLHLGFELWAGRDINLDDLRYRKGDVQTVTGTYNHDGLGDPKWAVRPDGRSSNWMGYGAITWDGGSRSFWVPDDFEIPAGIRNDDMVRATVAYVQKYDDWFLLEISEIE